MFLVDGRYDADRHHQGGLSVGVPGTVAGLHLAWTEKGSLPWRRLVEPAIALARDGFPVSVRLARSLASESRFRSYPASLAQFTRAGAPYEPGDVLKQPDLARTLERIAAQGPAGFYEGETARLIAEEVRARGGLITTADLAAYRAKRRVPIRGTYRGHEVISMPPVSSGGVTLLMMLNQLEHDDLRAAGFGSATTRSTSATRTSTPTCRWRASSRRNTARRCGARSTRRAPRPPRRPASSGPRRATRRRTSRSWTRRATRSR
jgi:gamma-glutamyltranspeptidase/glutathione hydrolase